MHHGVAAQIDSFGVWQLELDGGTEDTGYVTIYIGHDHPGSGLEGHGHTHVSLNAYLTEITHTEAFGYRPILLFFECKCGSADWNCQVDQVLDVLERTLLDEVGRDHLFTRADYAERSRAGLPGWPALPDLRGKLVTWIHDDQQALGRGSDVVFTPDGDEVLPGLRRALHSGECVGEATLKRDVMAGKNILSLDQYEDEASWSLCVPPNPIHVGGTATVSMVVNPIPQCDNGADCGKCAGLDTDPGKQHEIVHHGARGFPYPSPQEAYARLVAAQCWGWSMRISAGHYPGSLSIKAPLHIEGDGSGSATIGR